MSEPSSPEAAAELPMKGNLTQLEGNAGEGRFVFHDGPTYANGHLPAVGRAGQKLRDKRTEALRP